MEMRIGGDRRGIDRPWRRDRRGWWLSPVAGAVLFLAVAVGPARASHIVTRGTGRTVEVVSPTGGRPQIIFRIRRGLISSIGASANGRRIAVATTEARRGDRVERVWLMEADGRRPHVVRTFRRPAGDADEIDSIAISPDGDRLLVAVGDGDTAKLSTYLLHADGTAMREVKLAGTWFFAGNLYENDSGPRFAAHGDRILGTFSSRVTFSRRRRGIGLMPLKGGRIHFLRIGHPNTRAGSGFSPAMSPDGRWVAFVVGDGRTSHTRLMIMRSDGTAAHAVPDGHLHGKALTNPRSPPRADRSPSLPRN